MDTEHIKLNELRLELDNLDNLAHTCDRLREEIMTEFYYELRERGYRLDSLKMSEKAIQLEYYFSHVRDYARMAKYMCDVIQNDYKLLRKMN